jgi:hypothetical protein
MDETLDKILLHILCDFCCAPAVYTVGHPEDNHTSDRSM